MRIAPPSSLPDRPARFRPGPDRARVLFRMALLCVVTLCIPLYTLGCGGSGSDGGGSPGTVAILNQTDLGQAPLTVEAFFLEPVGGGPSAGNRLTGTVPPGGVVILGLFPPGLYNATAVLEGGVNQNWINEEIRAGEPKNFVIPPP